MNFPTPKNKEHTYSGSKSSYQTQGNNYRGRRYTQYERDPYNSYQNFLYNRALFGLSVYEKDELDKMHWDKRKRISRVHRRTQQMLNVWKQQIVNELSNHLFSTVFPDSYITEGLLKTHGNSVDPEFMNTIPFKLLKIGKDDIVDKLIEEGILPKNFEELKPEKKLETSKI